MAEKWIQSAVSRPGRMKRAAAKAGVSTHQYMEEHKDAPGSLGSAARLGLRLSAAAKGKKKLASGGRVHIHGEGEAPRHRSDRARRRK